MKISTYREIVTICTDVETEKFCTDGETVKKKNHSCVNCGHLHRLETGHNCTNVDVVNICIDGEARKFFTDVDMVYFLHM